MSTKGSVAASFLSIMTFASTAFSQVTPNQVPSDGVSRAAGTSAPAGGTTGPAIGRTAAGSATTEPKDNLASAMANFSVRTGLVVAPNAEGEIVVQHIRAESDAARSGIKPGDVLSRINGVEMTSMQAFQDYLRAHPSKSAFNVSLGRGDHVMNRPLGRQTTLLGMTVFPDSADRPIVDRVKESSPAAKAGIRTGDVIIGIDHQTTDTMEKFMNFSVPFIRDLGEGEKIAFRLARNGNEMRLSIPRPKDSELPPLSPSEQRVIDRQRGVLSTKTQEPVRQTESMERRRRPRRSQNENQNQNQNQGALTAQTGPGTMQQNPNQQGVAGIGGGIGLGVDGLAGGLGTTGIGSGVGSGVGTTGVNGMNSNNNGFSVVAVLFGTGQNSSQNSTGSAQNSSRMNNRQVGFVTIQSTVPLSQSQAAANGMGTTGTNGVGTNGVETANGTATGGVNGLTGTATGGVNGVNGTANGSANGVAQNAAGVAGLGGGATGGATAAPMTGVGVGTAGGVGSGIASGTSAASQFQSSAAANGITPGNPATTNIPKIGEGGVNPLTGNTGTGTPNQNAANNGTNNNNPTTVSAQVVGMAPGTYSLVVSQFGNCGDSAAIATGPVAANLGTIQVNASGQGNLQNASVQFQPQAFVGRVVSLVPAGGVGSGISTLARPTTSAAGTSSSANAAVACGVFRNANSRNAFANGGGGAFLGNGSANGTGNGTGTNGLPGNGGLPIEQPLGGQAAGGAAVGGKGR